MRSARRPLAFDAPERGTTPPTGDGTSLPKMCSPRAPSHTSAITWELASRRMPTAKPRSAAGGADARISKSAAPAPRGASKVATAAPRRAAGAGRGTSILPSTSPRSASSSCAGNERSMRRVASHVSSRGTVRLPCHARRSSALAWSRSRDHPHSRRLLSFAAIVRLAYTVPRSTGMGEVPGRGSKPSPLSRSVPAIHMSCSFDFRFDCTDHLNTHMPFSTSNRSGHSRLSAAGVNVSIKNVSRACH
mmetsp:Transcript_13513/g.35843  ORF Transcript_13513/g.35843 Transcript_13513/m.35843 type:complete len:247 (+) Transcript_13513:260-1000(+)